MPPAKILQIVPVLDIMGGRVVRGVAGRREDYQPVNSVLTESCEALDVAEAIRSRFGLATIYLADIDAILHRSPNLDLMRALTDAGFTLIVDAGLRRCEDATPIIDAGARQLVAGLETLAGPRELSRLVEQFGTSGVVFSLDLRDGQPIGDTSLWKDADPVGITQQAIAAGCARLIVLDIARVGTEAGVPTLPLCTEICEAWPETTIITGGGIRGMDDLRRLDPAIVDGVLIASALHNGAITGSDLLSLAR
jgi:phosphoribosylformimino-5-aminoimidazole carboxamide ribotide isomerase